MYIYICIYVYILRFTFLEISIVLDLQKNAICFSQITLHN